MDQTLQHFAINKLREIEHNKICHLCNSHFELVESDISLGTVIILRLPTFRCANCKTEILITNMMARIDRLISEKKITGKIDFCSIVELDDLPNNYFDK